MQHTGVKFYFDYISPYAYLAWKYFRHRCREPKVHIEPVPVLFAGLLQAHGQRGPAEIPDKRQWMHRNIVRKARVMDIPLNPPASHPFNPLSALRVSLLPELQDSLDDVVDAVFEAVWVRRLDVGSPAVLQQLLEELDLDAQRLLEQTRTNGIKEKLRRVTAEAVQSGVFGVPTMAVDGELFWGHDDIPNLELKLNGSDPLTRDDVDAWAVVRPSASRDDRR